MSADESFATLKNYFETKPAAAQALSALRNGVEIGVVIGDMVECALFQRDGVPHLERRPAVKPDIVFQVKPESVHILAQQPSEDIGDIGVSILKEVLAGNINIKVPGSFFNIMRNGYLDIMKKGGRKFWEFLASKGLTSLTKVTGAIRKMKG